MIALYFNVFIFVVQLLEREPALKALPPTQPEPLSQITQLLVLVLFIAVAIFARIRLGEGQVRTA